MIGNLLDQTVDFPALFSLLVSKKLRATPRFFMELDFGIGIGGSSHIFHGISSWNCMGYSGFPFGGISSPGKG